MLLLLTGLPLDQSSPNFRSRFGEPDAERYAVGNDIGLTVEYGSDGLVFQIVIERKQPLLHKDRPLEYMRPEVVSALIDEVVPRKSRGLSLGTALESIGCAEERVDTYENIWISRASDMCMPLKPERERRQPWHSGVASVPSVHMPNIARKTRRLLAGASGKQMALQTPDHSANGTFGPGEGQVSGREAAC